MAACVDTKLDASNVSTDEDSLAEELQAKVVEWRTAASAETSQAASPSTLPPLTIAVG